jgi:hypothetical protein
LGELVKCKISNIYPTSKNFCQARHIRLLGRIPERLAGHVRPNQISSVTKSQTEHIQYPSRVPERMVGHVRPNQISSATKSHTGHIRSASQVPKRCAEHVRPRPGHIRISDTPMARFSWGAIKSPPRLSSLEGHSIHIANILRRSLAPNISPPSFIQIQAF